MGNFLAALMTLRCLDVAEQRLRSGFSITLPLYYKDVQMGCETHSLTGKKKLLSRFLFFFFHSSHICFCIGRVFCFTQTSATDGLKRWNIQPHQQSSLTTKPLLLEGRHIFIKLKGIICSFHEGKLQNKGPNYIIKELYHLYKKDFKGNTVIEGKQKDISQLLIWLFFFCVLLHPFSSCLSLIIYAGLYSPHPHLGSLFWLQISIDEIKCATEPGRCISQQATRYTVGSHVKAGSWTAMLRSFST